MPTYDFICRSCLTRVEQHLPMADRDVPLNHPCDVCGQHAIERVIAAPGVSYTVDTIRTRTPDSFKDVLRNIKAQHFGSTIDV